MDQYSETKSNNAAVIAIFEHIAMVKVKAGASPDTLTIDILASGVWSSLVDMPKAEAESMLNGLKAFRSSKVG